MLDIVIRNGWVVDGTGAPKFRGSIGIKDGLIAKVILGAKAGVDQWEAAKIIDADEKVICPGFIDMHSHGDFTLLRRPFSPEKVWQGITTQTIGHCGFSAAPMSESWKAIGANEMLGPKDLEYSWVTYDDYLSILAQRSLGTNVAPFIGYGPIRAAVLGLSSKEPDRSELDRMCALLEEAMQTGVFGFTTGLAYPPQCQATTEELATLCEVVAHHDGLYASHVRDNTYDVTTGVKEAIEIGKRSGVRVHIAHLQIRPNPYSSLQNVISLMEEARCNGLEVTCDQYPYLAGQGPLTPLFPDWALAGGPEAIKIRLNIKQEREKIKTYMQEVVEHYFKWSDVILWSIDNENLRGRSVQTLAHLLERDPREVVMDLLKKYGISTSALYFGKRESDLMVAAVWPYAMVGTDGTFYDNALANHPRTFGTFPRMLRKYVREEKALALEEAIRRMTYLAAQTLRIADRGVIAEGKKADVIVLNPNIIADTATYESPVSKPTGIEYVIVNGKLVKELNEDHDIQAGEILRLAH